MAAGLHSDPLGELSDPSDLAELKAGVLCDKEEREGRRRGHERGGEGSMEKEKGGKGREKGELAP